MALSPLARRRRSFVAGIAVLPLALGLAACGDDDDDAVTGNPPVVIDGSETATTTPDADPTAPSDALPTPGADDQAILDAATTALNEVDGTIVSIDRQNDGWEIDVIDADGVKSTVYVAPDASGLTRPTDPDDDDADDRAENLRDAQGAVLNYSDALGVARSQMGEDPIDDLDLDDDDGRYYWEAQSDSGARLSVRIDAGNGSVLEVEQDD